MRGVFVLGVAAVLTACGPDSGDGPTPGKDFTCDPDADRVGTYLLHFTERSGNCGTVEDGLTRFDAPDPGCTLTAPTRTTNGGCTLETSVRCVFEDGTMTEANGISTQLDESGARVSSTMQFSMLDASGSTLCTSMYDVMATRQ